ncbi:MAG: DUF4040 domain-containing protein [Candidatus Omnitrophica bacterium]|nr:DUF4040 domain-containing protein [Candidatus Omnitrophota bacterium]
MILLYIPLFALLVLLAVASLTTRSLTGAAMLLGFFSFVIASLFAVMDAVDVSFTEAVVGAAISSLFFIAALMRMPKPTGISRPISPGDVSPESPKTSGIVLTLGTLAGFGILLMLAAAAYPDFGSSVNPAMQHVAPEYIERAYDDTHTPNMVTAVLADYRSYDTLGETTVVFTAGMAAFLLLGGRTRKS